MAVDLKRACRHGAVGPVAAGDFILSPTSQANIAPFSFGPLHAAECVRFCAEDAPCITGRIAHAFMRCMPPSGWCRTIGNGAHVPFDVVLTFKFSGLPAVANSGGPDSTALVFMLKRYVDDLAQQNERTPGSAYPMRVVSISVDHSLQESSTSMAELCAQRAVAMGVGHYGMSIPWNLEKYPDLPKTGVEGVARLARYELLHRGMEQSGSDIIAFGHHMDDQVERP